MFKETDGVLFSSDVPLVNHCILDFLLLRDTIFSHASCRPLLAVFHRVKVPGSVSNGISSTAETAQGCKSSIEKICRVRCRHLA